MKYIRLFSWYIIAFALIIAGPDYAYSQFPPAAPSNLQGFAPYNDQVKLTWVDNSNNETGFAVYQVIGVGQYQLAGGTTANFTSTFITGLSPNTTYTFVVSAYNSNGSSAYSNQATVTTPYNQLGAPLAPSGLNIVDIQTTTIRISWTDNSDNENGFKIARKKLSDAAFIIIDSVGSDVLTYQEVGLSPATDYLYKVCAYNRYGFSEYSNTVGGRTLETSGIEPIGSNIPSDFYLSNNYPNPFNPVTNITFGIPKSSFVRVTVFNSIGKAIEEIVSGNLQAGEYKVSWNASQVTSGIYFYRIEADAFIDVKKMILIK